MSNTSSTEKKKKKKKGHDHQHRKHHHHDHGQGRDHKDGRHARAKSMPRGIAIWAGLRSPDSPMSKEDLRQLAKAAETRHRNLRRVAPARVKGIIVELHEQLLVAIQQFLGGETRRMGRKVKSLTAEVAALKTGQQSIIQQLARIATGAPVVGAVGTQTTAAPKASSMAPVPPNGGGRNG